MCTVYGRPRLKSHMEYCNGHPEEVSKVSSVQRKVRGCQWPMARYSRTSPRDRASGVAASSPGTRSDVSFPCKRELAWIYDCGRWTR